MKGFRSRLKAVFNIVKFDILWCIFCSSLFFFNQVFYAVFIVITGVMLLTNASVVIVAVVVDFIIVIVNTKWGLNKLEIIGSKVTSDLCGDTSWVPIIL